MIICYYACSLLLRPLGERRIAISLSVCVSVCLSLCEHISGTAGPIFTKFCAQIPRGRGSVLFGSVAIVMYLLCTSGFTDDVTFCRNGSYGDSGVAILGRSLMSMNALLYLERLLCFKHQTQFALQYGAVYLVTIDAEFSDVAELTSHLLKHGPQKMFARYVRVSGVLCEDQYGANPEIQGRYLGYCRLCKLKSCFVVSPSIVGIYAVA